ncbi:hypothetical protein ETD86_10825 [Nonomuraea turkmeniaca]|uniref:Uncharacterized protein n=1 Tax=Nonomuraea turkmeniaca TaxID=103838 RepID=A0A5S4FPJ5_9ACTN|nr:hypothetical protein [Nonomuraea turkmeniaca]TMR22622.1 hypothetical protein ETD86_10825 [Nonomuraea turkmeniaca]
MSGKQQVEAALGLARGLLAEAASFNFQPSGLTGLVRRYSAIEFDVPDVPDVDGYLFQYGKVSWFSEPTFVLSLARQLEVVDSTGEHDYYIQVQFEFRYPLDDELEFAGSYSEWWFPEDKRSFDVWLGSIDRATIMNILAGKTPREFEIWQDQV